MLESFNEAMAYVEERLARPGAAPGAAPGGVPGAVPETVDVAEAARIAGTSEYHFRRMFSALAGMPLSEYVRRRRLTLAGAEVLRGRETLLDVAVRHGYGSGESFARAFRAMHGVGPGEARRTGAALRSQSRMSFRLVVEGNSGMRYRIVEKDEFRVVGRRARVPLVHEGMNPAIVEFVKGLGQETIRRLEELSDTEPRGVVAVTDDADESRAEGTELDYWHAALTSRRGAGDATDDVPDAVSDVPDVPDDMETLPVPAGTWAVFDSSGAFPETLQHVWRDVYTQWFPSNPYRSRPGPSLLSTRLSADGERADAELWVPVEPEG